MDDLSLFHVTSVADWLRPGLTGHNLEASAILHEVLSKTQTLAFWLGLDPDPSWTALQTTLENGLARLYCPSAGLFADNVGRRGCHGSERVYPQDGNSWVLISGLDLRPSGRPWQDPKSPLRCNTTLPSGPPKKWNISSNLRARWTAHGAPAVEFPNVISPFASGFELLAHCAAGRVDRAVELMLLEWGYLLDGDGFTNSTLAEGFRVDGHVQYPAYWSAARNSHAHGWSSGPTGVLTQAVLGIQLLAPGGGVWSVYPQLTPWLGWARGGFTTVKGEFEVKVWRTAAWRVDLIKAEGTKYPEEVRRRTGRKAVVAEVAAPKGTDGTIILGNGEEVAFERIRGREDGKAFWISWDDGETTVEDFWTVKNEDGGSTEDWYKSMSITVHGDDGPLELLYDEEFVEPEMEQRAQGVVDWDVMRDYFTSPPPEGWTLENMRSGGSENNV